MPLNSLITPNGSFIYFQGPSIETGPQPAVIFFALSAYMSLFTDPFNQAVVALAQSGIRVFSWDLPFHGPEEDPHQAMQHWAREFGKNRHFISDFISYCRENIDFLVKSDLIDETCLGVAGLSRGAFIATHLAAQEQRIQSLLGFAPLTHPKPLEETKHLSPATYDHLALTVLTKELVYKHVRFYIGNHDSRVGTASCFQFIHELTETAFAYGIRSPQVELIIYPSIGHKGHGTPPHIFHEGANWMKKQFIAKGPV